jgi:hypothetical protein
MATTAVGSWADVKDSILAGNAGPGISVGDSGSTNFTCAESYNVLFCDDIVVTGAVQAVAASTSTNNPLFRTSGARPDPYYQLRLRQSPACRTGSDGANRGAYRVVPPDSGVAIYFH